MKTIFLLFQMLLGVSVLGQNNCYREGKNILRNIIAGFGDEHRTVSLKSQSDNGKLESILNLIMQQDTIYSKVLKDSVVKMDCIYLTNADKQEAQKFVSYLKKFSWTNANKNAFGLNNFKLIDSRRSNNELSSIVYSITVPVIIRNCTIAFVYFYRQCGEMCGNGALLIFRKNRKGEWQEWKTMFSEAS